MHFSILSVVLAAAVFSFMAFSTQAEADQPVQKPIVVQVPAGPNQDT